MSNGNVTNFADKRRLQNGGNGSNGSVPERLAKLEGKTEHLATKADVEKMGGDLKQQISRLSGELSIIKWMIAGVGFPVMIAALKYLFAT